MEGIQCEIDKREEIGSSEWINFKNQYSQRGNLEKREPSFEIVRESDLFDYKETEFKPVSRESYQKKMKKYDE